MKTLTQVCSSVVVIVTHDYAVCDKINKKRVNGCQIARTFTDIRERSHKNSVSTPLVHNISMGTFSPNMHIQYELWLS